MLISRRLKSDSRVLTIKWQASSTEETFIVREVFPYCLAVAFSTLCANQAAFPNTRVILITGGRYHAVRDIFGWILRWADGDRKFPTIDEKPFSNLFRLCQAAHILEAQALADIIVQRVKSLANFMPQIEDIDAVYGEFASGHPARSWTVHSIATAIVGGRAKRDDPQMEKLCERRKDLVEDISVTLPKLRAAKEKGDAEIKKERADALQNQKTEMGARGVDRVQQLKDQIQKSLRETRNLNQTKKERDEVMLKEQKARRQQEYE